MRCSQLFGKTKKDYPKDEVSLNAQLLIKGGFVNKLMAGVYSYLPLGLRVLRNISQVAREEMEAIGGMEVLLPSLHPSEIWKQTGAWDGVDVLFKIQSRTEKEFALGQSHEEVIVPLVKEYVSSYEDLPLAVFQIQNKFRDELRAKSGILRGKEFLMKDMYSWHRDQKDFEQFYEVVKAAYLKVYQRLGLVAKVTEASGGAFTSKISYEFMVLTDAGEDDILYCDACEYCINVEIAKVEKGSVCPKCKKGKLAMASASEVGNVFDLGQKYSKDFQFELLDEHGEKFYPIMGCYGIGISRCMGVVVEKYADEKGIVWPKDLAPYQVHFIYLKTEEGREKAEKVYEQLRKAGIDVLFDDREDVSAGEKFATADLIGCPVRLVLSTKTGDSIEWKRRDESKVSLMSYEEAIQKLKTNE